jgi:hypothetical protein
MRVTVRKTPDASIGLPEAILRELGDPAEVEIDEVSGGFLVRRERASSHETRSKLEAIERFRSTVPSGIGFTEHELEELSLRSPGADRPPSAMPAEG